MTRLTIPGLVCLMVTFAAARVEAQDQEGAAVCALVAPALGRSVGTFIRCSVEVLPEGALVGYEVELGEGGSERCSGRYDAAGRLTVLTCEGSYKSHAMGPENAWTAWETRRTYGPKGALVEVRGSLVAKRFSDGKVTQRRAFTKADPEVMAFSEKVPLALDVASVLPK